MRDPVTTEDGHTYERQAITKWLLTKYTSPVTNLRLRNLSLFPNHSLRLLIEEYNRDQKHKIRLLF
jgi:hypothetical protein